MSDRSESQRDSPPARGRDSSEGRGEGVSPKDEQEVRLNNAHLRVRGLTRNVTASHVEEIMGTFGTIETMHFAMDDALNLPRGFADVTYAREEDGTKAKEFMHDGYIDGTRVSVVYRRNIGKDKRDRKKRALSPRDDRDVKRRRSPTRSDSPYRSRDDPRGRRPRSPSPYGWKGRSPYGNRSRSRSPRGPRSLRGSRHGGQGRKSWQSRRSPSPPRRRRSPSPPRRRRSPSPPRRRRSPSPPRRRRSPSPSRRRRSPSPSRRRRSRSRSLSRSPTRSRSYSYSSRSRSRSRSTSKSYSSDYSSLSRGRSPTPR